MDVHVSKRSCVKNASKSCKKKSQDWRVVVENSGKNNLGEWQQAQLMLLAIKIISYVALAQRNLHSLTKLINNILMCS